jgi:hypothetical protein
MIHIITRDKATQQLGLWSAKASRNQMRRIVRRAFTSPTIDVQHISIDYDGKVLCTWDRSNRQWKKEA